MKTRISAMMDGELEQDGMEQLLREMRGSDDLRRQWGEFQVARDALRGGSHLDMNVTARVMEALEAEPTVLLPARKTAAPFGRFAWSAAASACGVVLVAWVAMEPVAERPPLATVPAATVVAAVPAPDSEADARLREHLLAHHAHAPAAAAVAMPRHVRTVSAETRTSR